MGLLAGFSEDPEVFLEVKHNLRSLGTLLGGLARLGSVFGRFLLSFSRKNGSRITFAEDEVTVRKTKEFVRFLGRVNRRIGRQVY